MSKRSKVTLFALLALIAAFGLILTGCPDTNGGGGSNPPPPPPVPGEVTLEAGSHGTAGNEEITELTAGRKYLLKKVVGQTASWYTVNANGTFNATAITLNATSASGTEALSTEDDGVTTITGLDNTNTYGVYLYLGAVTEDAQAIPTQLNNGAKNAVVDISGLDAAETILVAAGAGAALDADEETAPSTIVFIIDDPIASGAFETPEELGNQADIEGTLFYGFTTTAGDADGAKVQAKTGDAFITLSNVGATTATTLKATTLAQTVRITAGSPGTPGTLKITVDTGKKYLVKAGNTWNAVHGTTGALIPLTGGLSAGAITTAEVAGFAVLGGGDITVPNGLYTVYLYSVLAHEETVGSGTPAPTVDNDGKNAVLNISTLANTKTVSVVAGAGNATAPSEIIFLIDAVIEDGAIDPAAPLADQVDIKGTLYYKFTTTLADSAKVQANTGKAFITLSNVGAATATTITATTLPSTARTEVRLGPGSWGTAGNETITGLPTGKQYVVFDGTDWHTVKANGNLEVLSSGLSKANLTTAASGSNLGDLGGTAITSTLDNNTTYTVYQYDTLAAGKEVGSPSAEGVDNDGKNMVLDITALAFSESVKVVAGAGATPNKSTLIFLLPAPIATGVGSGAIGVAEPLERQGGIKTTAAGSLVYGFSDTTGTASVQAKSSDAFIRLSNVTESTVTTLTASGVKLAAGSPGTIGNKEITGLDDAQYLVKNVSTGVWYSTKDGGTLGVFAGTGALTATLPDGAAAIGSGASGTITGLENGVEYEVYLYGTLENGKQVGTSSTGGDVDNGGKNAVLNISALVDTNTAKVIEGAGDTVPSTLYFIIGGEISGGAITETGLAEQAGIKADVTPNPVYYAFSDTDANGALVSAATGAEFIKLSNVGATTETTITVSARVKLAAGSQGTIGDKEITGLTPGAKYVVKKGAGWYGVVAEGTLYTSERANPTLAAGDAAELDTDGGGVNTISGLENDTEYDVYLLSPQLASTKTIEATGGDFNTGAKNVILDLTGLAAADYVSIKTGSTAAGTKIIGLTKALNADSDMTFAVDLELEGNDSDGSTLDYKFCADASSVTFAADGTTIENITAADTWFILTAGGNALATEIKALTDNN